MVARSINLETTVNAWAENEALKTGHSVSFIINFYLQKAKDAQEKDVPKLIVCPKHPLAQYSNRMPECPLCVEERTREEIKERDAFVITERGRLNTLIAEKQKHLDALVVEINALDPETSEQGKIDRMNKEVDELANDLRSMRQKLAELM